MPYTKNMAAILNQGQFNVDAALEDLKDNPTLAASIMRASIELAADKGILPKPTDRKRAAEESATTITLTRDQASVRAQREASRARAEEKEITPIAVSVADALRSAGIEVRMPHLARRLRSESSLTDQLIGTQVPREPGAQLIGTAVRHVFECSDRHFARAFKKAILAFDERGYPEVSTTNGFRTRSPTFVGIKTEVATPDGYRFEVEFHTADSYQAKINNHDTYKELQKLQELQREGREPVSQSIAEQLLERVRQACSKVVIPDGALDMPNWRPEADGTVGASLTRQLQVAPPSRTVLSETATEIVDALGARPIVLVGMAGAGKSTIGPRLANRLALPFIDSDKRIETAAGMSISDIFATKGEQHFSDLEVNEISLSLEQGAAVIATGGGAFMREETRRCIGEKAVSIWLDTDEGEIRKRLSGDTTRPLLQTENRQDKITQLIHDRMPFYQLADLTIVPLHKRDNMNANECVAALHAYLCGGGRKAKPRLDPLGEGG